MDTHVAKKTLETIVSGYVGSWRRYKMSMDWVYSKPKLDGLERFHTLT